MLVTRHADRACNFGTTSSVDRPVGARPVMRPGTTDKASAVAHYEAMARQVALERGDEWAAPAADGPMLAGAQRRG